MGTIRRGNYSFRSWKGDHSLRHVHIYRNGRFVAKWDLEISVVMKGKVSRRLRRILKSLIREGKL